jgi:spore germination protein
MRRSTVWVLLIIALLAAFVLSSGCREQTKTPLIERQEEAPPRPVLCAFYVNGRGQGSSYDSLQEHKELIDELSPLWYRLQGNGTLDVEVDSEALALARAEGIKTIPLVALTGNKNSVVLTDPVIRKAAVANISRVVRENGYDGINLDLEMIITAGRDYSAEREGLVALLKELHKELKPLGKRLDVCVTPPIEPPSHLAPLYDLPHFSQAADRIVMMAYDFRHSGSVPGPVALLYWVDANLKEVLAMGVPSEKISLGVAAYGYNWTVGGTRAIAEGSQEIKELAARRGRQISWDKENQVPYVTYSDPQVGERVVWFENGVSAAKKFELVKKYKLVGCSFWRLGFEDEDFWDQSQRVLE